MKIPRWLWKAVVWYTAPTTAAMADLVDNVREMVRETCRFYKEMAETLRSDFFGRPRKEGKD